jgi:RND family efflux transporter MFP subunit
MKKIVALIIVIAVVALAAMKLMAEKKKVAQLATPKPMEYTIQTTQAQEGVVKQKRSFMAKLQSKNGAKITTKLSGTITKVYVSESQRVKKGQLLVTIDDTALQTTLKTLRQTAQVQKEDVAYYTTVLERNKKLYENDALSKEKYDASKLQLANKKAALDATSQKIKSVESDLNYLKITAPFDGIVATIYLRKGDLATFSKPIMSLNSPKQKLILTYATTQQTLHKGAEVFVDNRLVAKVAKIYPDAQNNLSVAEATLLHPLAKPNNSYVTVEVVTQTQQGCKVPLNALVHDKEGVFILEYEETKFFKKEVDVVLEGDSAAIISPCPTHKIALGSESKLSILPFYKNVTILGGEDGK